MRPPPTPPTSLQDAELPWGCSPLSAHTLGCHASLRCCPSPFSPRLSSRPRPRLPGGAGDHGTSNQGLVRPETLTCRKRWQRRLPHAERCWQGLLGPCPSSTILAWCRKQSGSAAAVALAARLHKNRTTLSAAHCSAFIF